MGDGPAQLVEVEPHRGRPVVDPGDPSGGVDVGGAMSADGVDGSDETAVDVVLPQPRAPGRVVDPGEPAQAVVGELPLGPVGQDHPDEVGERVEPAGGHVAQGVDDLGRLAVAPVADFRARSGRVDRRRRAPRGRPFEPPHRAAGISALDQPAPLVVVQLGAQARGRHGGHHPPRLVPLDRRGVAVAVSDRGEVAVVVEPEPDDHAIGVGDPPHQAAGHLKEGDAPFRVDDLDRAALGCRCSGSG